MTHYGVDVSSIQHGGGGGIGWSTLFAHLQALGNAQPFVIIKVTEGTSYTNPYAAGDIAGAKAAGFAVATYAFDHPGDTAGSQAAYARAHDPGNLPIEEDLETTDGVASAQVKAEGMAFLADMGPNDLFYSYPSFIDGNGIQVPANQLWLADPNHPLGQPSRPCVIHQGQPTNMPGVSGQVDPDVFLGTEADFARLFVNVNSVPQQEDPIMALLADSSPEGDSFRGGLVRLTYFATKHREPTPQEWGLGKLVLAQSADLDTYVRTLGDNGQS